MLLRERSTQDGLLVSVCDEDALGDTFETGEVSLTVDPDFYDGEAATADEVAASLSRAAVANLVGHDAVAVAVELQDVRLLNEAVVDGDRDGVVADEVGDGGPREAGGDLLGRGGLAVAVAVDHGFVEEANVMELDGTVHAQYLRM